ILLRILPYREDTPRYFAYNESTREVHRLDGIGVSCVLLPDDQGIVFSNGYLLATGTLKTFEFQMRLPRFESKVASANGEDTQYIFRDEESGNYVLYTYNMIQRGMETPLI